MTDTGGCKLSFGYFTIKAANSEATTRLSRTTRLANSAISVAAVGLFGYLVIFYLLFNDYNKDLRGFIMIGTNYLNKSQASPTIRYDPTYTYLQNGVGYDGEFAYFIALDPANAQYYLDDAAYRYNRILYPILARLLALGNSNLVPLTLVLVNLLAVTIGTWAVASWNTIHNLSPWYALAYTFYIGQVLAFARDLNEILAYALVALGVYLFYRRPSQNIWAAIAFGMAGLAREQTLLFPLLYLVYLSLTNSKNAVSTLVKAGLFAVLSFGPAVAWHGFILWWLGKLSWGEGASLLRVPFSGLYDLYPLSGDTLQVVQAVVAPGTVCLVVAVLALWKDRNARQHVEPWALLVNALLFAVLLFPASLVELHAAGRVTIPIALCANYCLAYTSSRSWFYFCCGLWIASTIAFLTNPALKFLHV